MRYEWNMDVLRGSGVIFLLEASIEELARRVSLADRPRVNPGTTIEEDIRLMWTTSRDKYYAAADIVYTTDKASVGEEVADIKHIILHDSRFSKLDLKT